jgi:hypothetical protein|tara:strand:+ start:731 stop:1144 length:414 start_codon:yes stop_codon:yes gene_type:complete
MSKETDDTPEAAVDLDIALKQMKEDGHPPTGFHMMFFSEDFNNSHDCPMNQLLRKVGIVHDFEDTIKRQVFQLPQKQIMSYEFAWLGGYETLQATMEEIDTLLKKQFDILVKNNTFSQYPQARLSFLSDKPVGGEEE